MKSIEIQPRSALVGATLLGLGLLSMSAVQSIEFVPDTAPGVSQVFISPGTPLTINGIPTPQQMARVQEGTDLTVPPGKVFVVTGLGSYSAENDLRVGVRFGAQTVLAATISQLTGSGAGPAVVSVPPGMVAQSGELVQAVTLQGAGPYAVVLGYLAEE